MILSSPKINAKYNKYNKVDSHEYKSIQSDHYTSLCDGANNVLGQADVVYWPSINMLENLILVEMYIVQVRRSIFILMVMAYAFHSHNKVYREVL